MVIVVVVVVVEETCGREVKDGKEQRQKEGRLGRKRRRIKAWLRSRTSTIVRRVSRLPTRITFAS